MPTAPAPVMHLDALDSRGNLIGWSACNVLGKWVCHADGQTWVEPTQESAEESLRNAGAVTIRHGDVLAGP